MGADVAREGLNDALAMHPEAPADPEVLRDWLASVPDEQVISLVRQAAGSLSPERLRSNAALFRGILTSALEAARDRVPGANRDRDGGADA
jgi:hypothetical protein